MFANLFTLGECAAFETAIEMLSCCVQVTPPQFGTAFLAGQVRLTTDTSFAQLCVRKTALRCSVSAVLGRWHYCNHLCHVHVEHA